MADVTVKRLEEFEAIFGGGLRRVRAGLGVSSFGIAVIELPPNFDDYPEHDHAHDEQEEVYTVLDGQGDAPVGGEDGVEHELEPGVLARVGPARSGRSITGDERARVLALGGVAGRGLRGARVHRGGRARPAEGEAREHAASSVAVSGRGRRRRGAEAPPRRPGRPRRCTSAPAPRTSTAGMPRVLVAGQVGRGGELVGDRDRGRRELAALAVGAPAPVVERRQPGAADRDVGLAEPPGRPKLSAITTAGRGARTPPASSRADPARRGVGVDGQQGDSVVAGDVRGVDAGVGADPARVRLDDQHAALGADHRRDSRRGSARPARGSLPSRSASSTASPPGLDSARRRTRPSAFETTFCETTTTSPSREPSRGPRRRSARRAGLPRRSRAGPRRRSPRARGSSSEPSPSASAPRRRRRPLRLVGRAPW